jgi:hypothetical protein
MSADDHQVERSRHKCSASEPGRGPRRWPVRRSDLEVFLSADARKQRARPVDHALETEQDNCPEVDVR